jgi:hypothetical protein
MSRSPSYARFVGLCLALVALSVMLVPSPAPELAGGAQLTADDSIEELNGPILAAPLPYGDCDSDGDIDLADWTCAESCISGPGQPHASGCGDFDFDDDLDVDLTDLASLQVVFTGSQCQCDADINQDGTLNSIDVAMLTHPACWNRPASECPQGDLNCSGVVDQADMDIFVFCAGNPLLCQCDVP